MAVCPPRPAQCWSSLPLSTQELAAVVKRNFPAFAWEIAYSVARCESSRNPSACSPWRTGQSCSPGGECSVGLFQIFWACHPQFSINRLFDPDFNAQAALSISKGGTNWNPWACFLFKKNRQYLAEAKEALGFPAVLPHFPPPDFPGFPPPGEPGVTLPGPIFVPPVPPPVEQFPVSGASSQGQENILPLISLLTGMGLLLFASNRLTRRA